MAPARSRQINTALQARRGTRSQLGE
jgi:hypothetical protein